jgi:hypothetical protein
VIWLQENSGFALLILTVWCAWWGLDRKLTAIHETQCAVLKLMIRQAGLDD